MTAETAPKHCSQRNSPPPNGPNKTPSGNSPPTPATRVSTLKRRMQFVRRYGFLATRSFAQLVVMRVVLDRRGYASALRLATRITTHTKARRLSAEELARVVHAAGNVWSGPLNCLPRSLTLWTLATASNYPVVIRIGAARFPHSESLEAHAWVELDGQPLGERESIGAFVVLPVETADASFRRAHRAGVGSSR